VPPPAGQIFTDGWRERPTPALDPPMFVSLVIFTYDHHRDLPATFSPGVRTA
jgi:hypothetical protein